MLTRLGGLFFPETHFPSVSSSSNTPESWAGLPCPCPAPQPLCLKEGERSWHAGLCPPRSLPPLLETFSLLAEHRSQAWNPPGHFLLLRAVRPHILCFGLIVSDLPGGVLSLFSVDVFFILFLINNTGRGRQGGKEASVLLEFFQTGSSSLIFRCYFPPLKLLGSLLSWNKEEPFVQ